MNNGFTLIELLVVISLISIVLFFAVPRFQNSFGSDSLKKTSRWLITKVRLLKKSATIHQKGYLLHVQFDANRIWITDESMSQTEIENARRNAYQLPDDVRILDVSYANRGKISIGIADIAFYKNAYSDHAWIHMANNKNQVLSFLIEPFLTKVDVFETYVGFGG